jgi:hypothetical protein
VKDTAPEIEALCQSLWMQRTPEERLIRCALMFDAARELVLASLPKDLDAEELRKRLYERIYEEPWPSRPDSQSVQRVDPQDGVSGVKTSRVG